MRRLLVLTAVLACGPRGGGTRATGDGESVAAEDAPAPFVVAELNGTGVLARDGEYLYWAAASGIERRRLGGPEAGSIEAVSSATRGDAVTALAVHGGKVYVATDASVIAVPAAGPTAATPEVLTDAYRRVPALVADDSGVYASVVTGVVRLAVAAAPVELAGGQTEVTALALDGDHVYWVDRAGEVDTERGAGGLELAGHGAVRGVDKRGGVVVDIAADQPEPSGVAVRGGRIWWSTEDGVALRSRAPTGEATPRVEIAGAAIGMAADDRGVVVIGGGVQRAGLLLEKLDDGQARVLAVDAGYELQPLAPVLASGWVYVIAQRLAGDEHVILALPRRDHGVSFAVDADDLVSALQADAGALYVTRSSPSGARTIVARADAADGVLRPLGQAAAAAHVLTLGGDSVFYTDHAAIYALPTRGGTPTRLGRIEHAIFGMARHRDRLFWIDGEGLKAMSTSGGEPVEVARNAYGHGGRSDVDLVFDGDDVYTTSFRADGPGVYRIRAGEATPLWTTSLDGGGYPGPTLVRIGGELYFIVDDTVIYAVGLDGRSARQVHEFPGSVVVDMAAGDGLLYVLIEGVGLGADARVVRITPGADGAVTLMRWPTTSGGDHALLAADHRGAYVYVDLFGGILRLAHHATGLPVAPGSTR